MFYLHLHRDAASGSHGESVPNGGPERLHKGSTRWSRTIRCVPLHHRGWDAQRAQAWAIVQSAAGADGAHRRLRCRPSNLSEGTEKGCKAMTCTSANQHRDGPANPFGDGVQRARPRSPRTATLCYRRTRGPGPGLRGREEGGVTLMVTPNDR